MRGGLCTVAVLLVSALLLTGCKGGDGGASQQALQQFVGTSLADITVQDLDGVAQRLDDPLLIAPNGQHKPVVVNVWATWCAPCLAEMPTLDALGRTGKYTVLAIATDKDTQTVKDFLKKQNWGPGVTVLFDRLSGVTRQRLGASALPVTYVTDPSLTVKMAAAGERDWNHPSMQGKMLQALK